MLPHFEDITTVAIGEPSNTAARMQGKSRTSQQVKEESETMQEGQMSAQMASEQHHTSQSGCDQPKGFYDHFSFYSFVYYSRIFNP